MHWLPDATTEADSSGTEEKTSLVGATGKRLPPRWAITSGHTGEQVEARCALLPSDGGGS